MKKEAGREPTPLPWKCICGEGEKVNRNEWAEGQFVSEEEKVNRNEWAIYSVLREGENYRSPPGPWGGWGLYGLLSLIEQKGICMYKTIYGVATNVQFCAVNDCVEFTISGRTHVVCREYFFGFMQAKKVALEPIGFSDDLKGYAFG